MINAHDVLLNEKNCIIEQLTAKCAQLESQLNNTSTGGGGDSSNLDFYISSVSNTLHQASMDQAVSSQPTTKMLSSELERSLILIQQKRAESVSLHAEIERLKMQLQAATTSADCSEELHAELEDKRRELDEALAREEDLQQAKSGLEQQLHAKRQHCDEYEKLVEELNANILHLQQTAQQHADQFMRAQQDMQQRLESDGRHLAGAYETQLAEFKLKLANAEHAAQKVFVFRICK